MDAQIMTNPEIGQTIDIDGVATNYHDNGRGSPIMLIHGSGPGVTAWANWRLTLPVLAQKRRVIAPDMLGFGYTERPADNHYSMQRWLKHLLGLMDKLQLERVDLIGNSFGGALALAFAIAHPERVRRLVLMGSVGVSFPLTDGLDRVWGYTPSAATMRELISLFSWNQLLVNDDLAELRYRASIQPGFQEAFAAMFPTPRQQWVDALASSEEDIRALPHQTLLIHGRDDQIIPLQTSLTMASWIAKSQLHVFGQCGHWTQIEQADRFTQLVDNFFSEADQEQ
jgi:2-hydroxymuconate-semialdehyde hydrolase